jgi:hypothetical protein
MAGKPDRAWRLELSAVPGHRSAIQFHYGQDESWSEGCFILGVHVQPSDASGIGSSYCKLTNGESAVSALRAAVKASGKDTNKIEVTVADYDDLFTGLPTHC